MKQCISKLKAYGDLYRFVVLAMNGTKPLLVTQSAHSKETHYTYIHSVHSLQAWERQKTHGTPSSILFLGAQIHCIISLVTLSGGSRSVSDIFENPMGNLCCLVSIRILLETSTRHMQFCLESSRWLYDELWWAVWALWMVIFRMKWEMLGKHLEHGRSKVVQRFGKPKLWSRKM